MSRGRGDPSSSRSRRPGRSSSQVRRRRNRRGWSGGSIVDGWSASTTGPSRAASRSVMRRASVELLARTGSGQRGIWREPGELADRGRRQDARRHPPADVELLGAGHRERQDRRLRALRDDRPAVAHRAEAARRSADRALRHLDEDRAVREHRPRRGDVTVDADAAAPHRQQATDALRRATRATAP